MRLIDADALDSALLTEGFASALIGYQRRRKLTVGEVRGILQRAPTIDPVKWIPVSERLPEGEREAVLAYQRDFNEAHIAWISGGDWEDTSGTFAPGKVTHWMPLPEPPRKDDEA